MPLTEPLSNLINPRHGGRPPWTWSNLTEDEAEELDSLLDSFVACYNITLALQLEHIIPRCWREHPALAQELPVQYWGWWASHRDPRATPLAAMEYYNRHLPAFQGRLTALLGLSSGECRKGRHGSAVEQSVQDAAAVASDLMESDTTARQALLQRLRSIDMGVPS